MGKRHKPPPRQYPLHQSPLFKCRSRARLASELNLTSVAELEALANDDEKTYRFFTINRRGESPRAVQQPIGARERVHTRLFHLLRRITPPDYLHSGVSGRSNVTNAKPHVGAHPLLTTDIKQFYESTTDKLVNGLFRGTFQCSPDVSAVLTRLCTADGHIPTGSIISQLVAYMTIKPRLDEFAEQCQQRGVTMTVYVDDITISGRRASKNLRNELKRLLRQDGYDCHKDTQYRSHHPKIVTGVVVTSHGVRVRNRQHQKIYEELRCLLGEAPNAASIKQYQRIRGRVAAASQIDQRVTKQKGHLESWQNSVRSR